MLCGESSENSTNISCTARLSEKSSQTYFCRLSSDCSSSVIRERAAVFELLPGEDEPLLLRRDALLVLDLGLDVLDGVIGLQVQRDGLVVYGIVKGV